MTIREIRDRTEILCPDVLEEMAERMEVYRRLHGESDEEALAALTDTVGYGDFAPFFGKEAVVDGERVEIVKLEDFDRDGGLFGPETAQTRLDPRCSDGNPNWESVHDVRFPVPRDLKIRFRIRGDGFMKSVFASYNQISGTLDGGRLLSFGDPLYWKSEANRKKEWKNEYFVNIVTMPIASPLPLQTPAGEPEVADLVGPGDLIRIVTPGILTREYVVESVSPFERRLSWQRDATRTYRTYSLSMIDPSDGRRGLFCNELVAVGGRIRGFFAANDTTVEVVRKGAVKPKDLKTIAKRGFPEEEEPAAECFCG